MPSDLAIPASAAQTSNSLKTTASWEAIITRKDIVAENLQAAIKIGFQAMQQHNTGAFVTHAVAIEIWSGTHDSLPPVTQSGLH
jgi:hypothetical protein